MAFAFPDYGTAGTFSNVIAGLNCAWNSGSAPADNDFLVMVVSHNNTTTGLVTVPSGWTSVFNDNNGNNYVGGAVFWKIASSEPTSYTVVLAGTPTGKHMSISMLAISGNATGTPQSAEIDSGGVAVASLASATITPATTGSLLINCWLNGPTDASGAVYTVPSGYTSQVATNDGSGTPWVTAIQSCNTLTTLSTTTSVTAGPTGATPSCYEDMVSFVIAPSGGTTVTPTFTDTISAVSDSFTLAVVARFTITDNGPAISDTLNDTSGIPLTFTDTIAAISDILGILGTGPAIVAINFVDTISKIADFMRVSGLGELSSGNQTVFPQAGNSGTLASQTLNTHNQNYFKPTPPGTTQAPGPQTFFPFGPPAAIGTPTAPLSTPSQTIFPQEGT